MRKARLYNLMFHGIVDSLPSFCVFDETKNCFVKTDDFERIIHYCSKKFKFITQSDIPDYVSGKAKEDGVFVTFDDGLKSVITHALPILLNYNVVPTVFVTSGWLDSGASPVIFNIEKFIFENLPTKLSVNINQLNFNYEFVNTDDINIGLSSLWDELFTHGISPLSLIVSDFSFDKPFVDSFGINELWVPSSWSQLKDAVDFKSIELGLHGVSHAPWSQMNENDLRFELQSCYDRIYNLTGYQCKIASFPHGLVINGNFKVLDEFCDYYFANNMKLQVANKSLLGRILVPFNWPNSFLLLTRFRILSHSFLYFKSLINKLLWKRKFF